MSATQILPYSIFYNLYCPRVASRTTFLKNLINFLMNKSMDTDLNTGFFTKCIAFWCFGGSSWGECVRMNTNFFFFWVKNYVFVAKLFLIDFLDMTCSVSSLPELYFGFSWTIKVYWTSTISLFSPLKNEIFNPTL